MKIVFEFTLDDFDLNGEHIDNVNIKWDENVENHTRLIDVITCSMNPKKFLTAKIPGLSNLRDASFNFKIGSI